MGRNPLDHGHHTKSGGKRAAQYLLIDRIRAGEGGHRKIQMLVRRRKGRADPTRMLRFLQIERGLGT